MQKLLELAILADQLREGIAELISQSGVIYPGPVSPPAKPITQITIENLGDLQVNVPVTFGHVFAQGHLPSGMGLKDAQLDVKATHPDGSVRHGVISVVLPKLGKDEHLVFPLVPEKIAKDVAKEIIPTTSLALEVTITIGGRKYTAERAVGEVWLNGPIVQELYGNVPLQDETNKPHPHLSTRLALRMYENGARRFDVSIENAWAYEAAPQNFTYGVTIAVAGKVVFSQTSLTHYHHARWRKVFWMGESPNVHVRHDTAYLIASRAVPNYDQSIKFTEQSFADGAKSWAKAGKAPMETGLTMRSMPTTGGRGDIGIMPSWASAYLLTMDKGLKEATIETANLAGSFPMHYRDKDTGQPVSLIDYPYMTLAGNPGDTYNPVTKKREAFPVATSKDVTTPNKPDIPHHPGLPYLPYLVTGDLYHLEELQFWAMYCVFNANPGAKYRDGIKGLLKSEQTRGEAWGLRTIGQAAYITPDSDRLKSHFNQIVDSNLDWYNAEYTDNPNANKLGALVHGYAVIYKVDGKKLSLGPWQDDFFASVIGQLSDFGYEKATKLLKWKTKFVTQRMIGEGACPTHAASYSLRVRATETGPIFDTIGQALRAMDTPNGPLFLGLGCGTEAQAKALGLEVGEMTGYAAGNQGYPAIMQSALAYAADYYGEQGKQAWQKFMSRSVKPDYSKGPQFALLPRNL